MKTLIISVLQSLFLRKRFFKLNSVLYNLVLSYIGVGNYRNFKESGEEYVSNKMSGSEFKVVFDVGAYDGESSKMMSESLPAATIYSFEPQPENYLNAKKNVKEVGGVQLFNYGFSDVAKNAVLFDSQPDGSQLATMYPDVITEIHKEKLAKNIVKFSTIDLFAKEKKLSSIDFLKIDTEGHELSVLKGASDMLKQKRIKMIQFEFNEMNVVSRVFFKDFWELLNDFNIYRLLPDGVVRIMEYNPKDCEIFHFQNYLAINKKLLNIIEIFENDK